MAGASGLGLEPGKVGLEFFQQPVEAVHTVTVVKGRMEVHGFFKQVSAGVSNGVRIKGGGAAPEGRVCLWRKIRFSFLESHRVTRLAAGGTLSGGRYHDVTRAIAVVGSIRIGCLR